jgi:hypothetical protein
MGTELPSTINGRCYEGLASFSSALSACETESPHGTAVAEAIIDVAPGVELYIANPRSPLDLRDSVEWMIAQGVRVINHSVGWTWSGPGDGTSEYPSSPVHSVAAAVEGGALWVNAAGNDALSTWSGPFRDVNSDNWMEFSASSWTAWTNAVTLKAGQLFVAQARWDDKWGSAIKGLELHLLNGAGVPVAYSDNSQSGYGDDPYESLSYLSDDDGTYYLALSRVHGPVPSWVQVQAFTGETLALANPQYSICSPAESSSQGALAVGASYWNDTQTLEIFSSRGPTRDGRMKPDLVAVDGGDSTTYGPGGFFGTSQSAAHVSGLAALFLGAFPSASPVDAAEYLRSSAISRGGPQASWGAGLAQLPVFPPSIQLSRPLITTPKPLGRRHSVT